MNEQVPLLPAWATDADVAKQVDILLDDIETFHKVTDYKVREYSPRLCAETEAYLRHVSEGW